MSKAGSVPAQQACPCGRCDPRGQALSLAACCGRYLDDFEAHPAPDPESLMRSRYTAYVLGRPGYLLDTWHPETRPERLDLEVGVRWLGLEVRAAHIIDADRGQVEFVARQRDPGGRAHRLHERSRFQLERGRWYYVDGAWL